MVSSQPTKEPSPAEVAFLQYQMSVKDQTRQPAFHATIGVCMFFCYTSVVLRLLARRIKSQKLMADDWWIIGALLPVTVFDAFNFWTIYTGLGLHIVRIADTKAFIQSAVGSMVLYPMCLPPIKYSILFLYQRIFPSETFRNISIFIAVIVTGMAIAASVAFGLQCVPLSSLWSGNHGKCLELNKLAIATGIVNIVTDVAILALPIGPLLHLRVSFKVRLGLIATFLLGGCVCVFSIIRTKIVAQSSQADPSWNNAIGGMWSVIEVHIAIVSANLPVLKPLFVRNLPENSTSYGRPIVNSSGYVRSGDTDGASKKNKYRGPYSITNNSLWKDDDEIPLQDIEQGKQGIDKQPSLMYKA